MEEIRTVQTKIVDSSGWVTLLTQSYDEEGNYTEGREFRRARPDDVIQDELAINYFDGGQAPAGLYRRAECVEIDSDEERGLQVVISKGAPREVTCSTPSTSRGYPVTEDPGTADLLLDMEASDFESEEEEIPATVPDLQPAACRVHPTETRKTAVDRPKKSAAASRKQTAPPKKSAHPRNKSAAPPRRDAAPPKQTTTTPRRTEVSPKPAATPSASSEAEPAPKLNRQQRKNRRRRERQRAARRAGRQARFIVIDEVAGDESPSRPSGGDSSVVGDSNGEGSYCPTCSQRLPVRDECREEITRLPWWVSPERACWRCRRRESSLCTLKMHHAQSCPPAAMSEHDATTWVHLCNGLLQLIRKDLNCRSNADLLALVVAKGYYPKEPTPLLLSLEQRLILSLWEQRNRLAVTPLEELTVQPPSVVACLLFPEVLNCIVLNLSEDAAAKVAKTEVRPPEEAPLSRPPVPSTVDAHIHLDVWGANFRSHLGLSDNCRLHLSCLVANFAHPARWNVWDQMDQQDLACVFGIHPVVCAHEPFVVQRREEELRRRLRSPRCVALGEVGLDYVRCTSSKQRTEQRQSLLYLLRLRPTSQPIVVHCRGKDALSDCLRILKQRVEDEAIIQVHCFLGGREEVDQWRHAFPRCLFSMSPKSLTLSGPEAEEHCSAVRGLRLEDILLETDAPHLGKSAWTGQKSSGKTVSPRRDLYRVGEWIAQLKGLCPSIVLEAAGHNARLAFGIPTS